MCSHQAPPPYAPPCILLHHLRNLFESAAGEMGCVNSNASCVPETRWLLKFKARIDLYNWQEAKALLGRNEYCEGYIEVEGIDIAAVKPKIKLTLTGAGQHCWMCAYRSCLLSSYNNFALRNIRSESLGGLQ
nr:PREDICTED: uncharacterized protein LOC101298581 isoform X2 [Fragaria vesca subsp. vesca]